MSEHERTTTLNASAQDAFRYLSSVSNLPDFVPHLRNLREDEENHVRGTVDFGEGQRQEVSGFFRADPANLRLDWESDGTPGYRGWLQITPNGKKARITVHISMRGAASEEAPADAGLAGDRIERGFDSVMKAIESAMTAEIVPNRSAV
jgi:uncharacterized membrane protein